MKTFYNVVGKWADTGDPFELEKLTTAFAFDVIYTTIFGTPSRAQVEGCEDLNNWKDVVNATTHGQAMWNPVDRFMLAKQRKASKKRLVPSIAKKIYKRLDELSPRKDESSENLGILDAFLERLDHEANGAGLTKASMETAIVFVRTLYTGGTLTTSDTLCFVFTILSEYPDIVEKLRSEHRQVYSNDPDTIISMLQSDPGKLKELEYTTRVIKEVLRLYPVANTIRKLDRPGCIIHDGIRYPLAPSTMICPVQHTWHMDPAIYPNPDSFDPDRFIGMDRAAQLAWYPFGRGNRACMGQVFAMEEMKMVLLLTMQFFDFKCVGLEPRKTPRVPWTKMDLVLGDYAFQEDGVIEGRLREGMMMTATRVKTDS